MSTLADTDLLALAARLANEAAEIIRTIRARGFETVTKTDSSPVTEADHAAEAHILRGLRAATPDIPVIAEEEVAAGLQAYATPAYWLVDPLDGTREFAAGRDDFTVNIGLVRNGHAALGAMALPAYHQLYTGGVGLGAHRLDKNGLQAIHVRTAPAEGLSVLASRHHADDTRLAEYLNGKKIAHLGNIGSAVKFARVAEGWLICTPASAPPWSGTQPPHRPLWKPQAARLRYWMVPPLFMAKQAGKTLPLSVPERYKQGRPTVAPLRRGLLLPKHCSLTDRPTDCALLP